jgi:hypothetical protein
MTLFFKKNKPRLAHAVQKVGALYHLGNYFLLRPTDLVS